MKNFSKFGLVTLSAVALAVPAMADITFNLTTDNCTGSCLTGVVGTPTVLLHQQAAGAVKVTVTLPAPLQFVNTGLVNTVDFNLGAIVTGVTADTFSNAHFSLSSSAAGSNHFDGFGNFAYTIIMDTAQGAGGAQNASPLSFIVHATGLLETSFTTNASGWNFGVDVYNPTRNVTGPIGGNNGTGGTLSGGGNPVPEPSSVMLFGTAVLGMVFVLKRRFAKQA